MTDSVVHEVSTSIGHWIAGAPVTGSGRRHVEVLDPAAGEARRSVDLADAAIVARAVQAAAEAADRWAETPVARRAASLSRWAGLIREAEGDLVALLGEEHGKVPADAEGEVLRGVEALEFAAGAATLLTGGEFSDQVSGGIDVHSVRRPLGVCAAITPFNFPVMIPLWLTSAAIACGNTVVLKPSERDPSCSLLLAELAAAAGIPDGVLNVVQGDKVAVDALLDHPEIKAVGFVGSTPVARYVSARASSSGKRVQAFGGAKNHMLVLPDADLDFAADAATSAAFGSTGQRCMATSVVVAVGDAAEPLVERIRARAAEIRTGPASDAASEMGPLVSAAARERVIRHVEGARQAGAEVLLDGSELSIEGHEEGFFVGPTVVDRVTAEMDLYLEEVFGPVLAIVRVGDLDEGITLVNANAFGNGAIVFTANGWAAREFARRARAGMIGVNVPIPIPVARYSFGGWKDSRFADVHMAGPEAFRFFTQGQIVTTRWPKPDAVGSMSLAFAAKDGE